MAALQVLFEPAMSDPNIVAYAGKTNGLPYPHVAVDKVKAVFAALAGVSPAVLATVCKVDRGGAN